ncbi:hypothetical protein LWC34_52475 [Kibdelosporangium philippinense]|uniref:CdiI immunity protein domain-containing protein n=1 Tax=Kibdelosporangium philippinense TaxID=211113 RepID=A0ABS8ZUJ4_9PSEU|nr:hypothetical protein [Kibdelosporangium philippinense]MCE7011372.1 hypothetical protein [Kibdelosporangium philippinense]
MDEVFAGVPRVSGKVSGCSRCYSEAELELFGGDPALVPDRLVVSFATDATDHWSEDQYGLIWRGLAPRILRLLDPDPDERVLRGLSFARFSTWPEEEQAAVRHEVREIVTRAFTTWDHPFPLEELLCAVAYVDGELAPWLGYLDTLGADADAPIALLAEQWASELPKGTLLQWRLHDEDSTEPIRDWLYSDALHDRLKRMGD